MAGLVQADRKDAVTHMTTIHNRGEQKSKNLSAPAHQNCTVEDWKDFTRSFSNLKLYLKAHLMFSVERYFMQMD